MSSAPDSAIPQDPMLGRVLAGQYEIERLIGRGGMGRVYLAQQRTPPAKVVVKVLSPDWADDPEALARFEREAERLNDVEHSNIVEMFDYGLDAGQPYIVMEYIDGEPLSDYMKRRGALKPEDAIPIIAQVLKATGYAHSRGMMLRDIKPSNVMLCEHKGRANFVKILDFGLAKLLEDDKNVTKTHPVGTAGFMAPEAIRGEEIDLRVDVYALGVMFYAMLTGRLPFEAESDTALLYQHVNEEPPNLAETLPDDIDLPEGLSEIIHQCLAKKPSLRPADANAIVERLIDVVPMSMFRLPRADGKTSSGQSVTGKITGLQVPPSGLQASGPSARAMGGDSASIPVPAAVAAAPAEPPSSGSKTGLMLAGVAAIAGIAVAAVMFMGGGDDGDKSADTPPPVEKKDTAELEKILEGVETKVGSGDFGAAGSQLDAIESQLADEPSLAARAGELRARIDEGQSLAAAAHLEAEGKTQEALSAYRAVLTKFASNADAKAAVKRLEEQIKAELNDPDAKTGELVIQSVPAGRLYIDGVEMGKTPFTGQVKAGQRKVRVEVDGFYSKEANVGVKAGGSANLQWTLNQKRKKRGGKSHKPSTDPTPSTPPPTESKKPKPPSGDGDSDLFMETKKKKKSDVFLPVGDE